ncbi:hypothetical protein PJE062_3242 [Pseudovibrio sp. JE062]|nr:hypothetical protein PJE062_3242 [Pseudovibrio sp. JE062]
MVTIGSNPPKLLVEPDGPLRFLTEAFHARMHLYKNSWRRGSGDTFWNTWINDERRA